MTTLREFIPHGIIRNSIPSISIHRFLLSFQSLIHSSKKWTKKQCLPVSRNILQALHKKQFVNMPALCFISLVHAENIHKYKAAFHSFFVRFNLLFAFQALFILTGCHTPVLFKNTVKALNTLKSGSICYIGNTHFRCLKQFFRLSQPNRIHIIQKI